MEENEILELSQADLIASETKAMIDMQIATAKQYPRDVKQVLKNIEAYASEDKETAEECFYVLRRQSADGSASVIEGLSVRMAEIIASCWGNMRIQTRIVGNDGKMITAQAICHDLETNLAVSKEVKRRITNKYGKTYSEDMQVVTGNAASAIAFRNAVLAVIPKAVTKKITNHIKKIAIGQSIDIEQARQNALLYFQKLGVDNKKVMEYLGVSSVPEIDKEMIAELKGTRNAIEEGTTTVKETFFPDTTEVSKAQNTELFSQVSAQLSKNVSKVPKP